MAGHSFDRARFRISLLLVEVSRLLVPARRRPTWHDEWRAEIWHAWRRLEDAATGPDDDRSSSGAESKRSRRMVRRAAGSFRHALYLRASDWRFDVLWQDLRYAARSLAVRPMFTALTVATLALGIGANTVVFSVAHSTLIEPLPFPDGNRLVYVWMKNDFMSLQVSARLDRVREWQQSLDSFEELHPIASRSFFVTGAEEPRQLNAARVDPGFFGALGVQPALGRAFVADDAVAGAPEVVVLSHGLWQELLGGRTDAVGTELQLNDEPHLVIGVMPEDFRLQRPFSTQRLWTPLRSEPGERIGVTVLGKLAPDVSLEAANAELRAFSTADVDPEADPASVWVGSANSPQSMFGNQFRVAVVALQAAIGFVLLIATANVANLLLAVGVARRRELGVRAAIGAGRARLVRQLMTEGFLLSAAGGLLGGAVALVGVRVVSRIRPPDLAELESLRIDPEVLGFTLIVSVLTGILFSLAPCLQTRPEALFASLRGTGGDDSGHEGRLLRNGLVVVEVAISTVLLVAAGLLMASFARLQQTDPGFDASGLVALQLRLPETRYGEGPEQAGFYERVTARIRTAMGPSLTGITVTNGIPPRTGIYFGAMEIEADQATGGEESSSTMTMYVNAEPQYFDVTGIPIVAGRPFRAEEVARETRVAIVNEEFTRHHWPDDEPLGKRFRWARDEDWYTVVGVAGDVRHRGLLSMSDSRQVYVPLVPGRHLDVLVRVEGDPLDKAELLAAQVREVDPDVPIESIATVEALLAESIAAPRFYARLMAAFSGAALALAIIGIYGVLSYTVSQRRHEIGVRIALGARPGRVLRLVVGDGMFLVVVGLGVGLLGAAGLSRFLGALLHGVGATDGMTYAGVAALLVAACLMACSVPAVRAARVDPLVAMRMEG